MKFNLQANGNLTRARKHVNPPDTCPFQVLRHRIRLAVKLLIALGWVLVFLARFPVGRSPGFDVSMIHFVDLDQSDRVLRRNESRGPDLF